MTKAEYIEEIRIRLANGIVKPENKTAFHPEFLARAIESAMKRVMYSQYKDTDLDYCSKTYRNVDVLYDTELQQYYSVPPEQVVQLPKNKGLRHVSPMNAQEAYFIPLKQQSARVFNNLNSGKIARRPGYYFDGNRVTYEWISTDVTKVLMKLVVPFSKLEDTDIVYVQDNAEEIMWQFILQYIGVMIPQDKTNNNNRNDGYAQANNNR
jgi:hypothetical protein